MICPEIRFAAPGIAALEKRTFGEPGPRDVFSRTLYTVVSAGTERAMLMDLPNTPHAGCYPKAEGYSAVSIVEKVGGEVTKVRPGDRVLVYHGTHCLHSMVHENHVYKVTEAVDDLDAAFVIIGAMGLGGLRKTRLELGESCMIIGLGLLGFFALQGARASGAVPLIAADRNPERLTLAENIGADYAFDTSEADFQEKVREVTRGTGVNAIVEVTGASAALMNALDVVAKQGRIALNGCTRVSDCPIDFYRQVHQPGVSLIGAHNMVRPMRDSSPAMWTNEDDCHALLRLIEGGRVRVKPLIHDIVSPTEADKIYARLAQDRHFPLGVVFDWNRL